MMSSENAGTGARILGISGSLREGSFTRKLVDVAMESARNAGAEVRLLDLRDAALPLYEAHADYDANARVAQATEAVAWANGYVLGSPEYHGCMSGATKNFLDFLYREIAGKVFGLVSATGGSMGVSCFDTLRTAVQHCHGWSLPYNAGATGRQFDAQGNLSDAKVRDRLERIGRDLAVYAPLLHGRFLEDLAEPAGAVPGFAKWMA